MRERLSRGGKSSFPIRALVLVRLSPALGETGKEVFHARGPRQESCSIRPEGYDGPYTGGVGSIRSPSLTGEADASQIIAVVDRRRACGRAAADGATSRRGIDLGPDQAHR